jgi:hypothetical protein
VIQLRKANNYLLSQTHNADEMLVYFNMPSSFTMDDAGAKSVVTKTSNAEKM